jgi:hypothetical protein
MDDEKAETPTGQACYVAVTIWSCRSQNHSIS